MEHRNSELDAEKLAWNIESEGQMRQYLCSLTWEQKVASIERMNKATRTAREAMREALKEAASEESSRR